MNHLQTALPRSLSLGMALVLLAALSSACMPSSRRGANLGFDYFLERKTCDTEPVAKGDREKYLQIHSTLRAAFALENQKVQRANLVITGDSIAALFMPHLMTKYLPGVNAANRGIGGDTVALLTSRLDTDVLPLRPRNIAISIGGNDVLQGRCMDHTINLTREMILGIQRKSPGTRVLMTSLPPTLTWKANQIMPFYNWQLKYLTEELANVEYLDLWREMSEKQLPGLANAYHAQLPGGITDVIHFGEEGYRVWAGLIRKKMR